MRSGKDSISKKRKKKIPNTDWPILTNEIKSEYHRIMKAEANIAHHMWCHSWHYPYAAEMWGTAIQILDVARLSFVPRSYNKRYGLSRAKIAYESVGAHTYLALSIFNAWHNYEYGPYRELSHRYNCEEALRRHDLPEIAIGDIPDAGERDESAKIAAERNYFESYSSFSPLSNKNIDEAVNKMLYDMEEKTSHLGRSIYVADKISALIITLACDKIGIPPKMKPSCKHASPRDRYEMSLCDYRIDGACYASEMWAIDYLKARLLNQYDDKGYYTALLVMCTLLVNGGEWYSWREADY